MKKNFYLAVALLGFSISLNAQVKGVGIKTDHPNATLDVRAEAANNGMPDGVLVPRLTVTELNAKYAVYGADQNGALVFVTSNTQGTPGTKVENVKDPGFYYYDHATSKWKGVGGGSSSIEIKTSETPLGKVDNVQLFGIKGSFTVTAASGATIPLPLNSLSTTLSIYSIKIYDRTTKKLVASSLSSYDVAHNKAVTGMGNMSIPLPVATYDYVLEYFK
jgi:hypothetical protein